MVVLCSLNLQSLANECRYLSKDNRSVDTQIATAVGWVISTHPTHLGVVWTKDGQTQKDILGSCFSGQPTEAPWFTLSLDAVKYLISLAGGCTHYGVLQKFGGGYSAFVTVCLAPNTPAKMFCSENEHSDVLALCSATLEALAHKYKDVV